MRRDLFSDLVEYVDGFKWRPELDVQPMPSPQRIAPHSLALEADVLANGQELGTGRLIVLHNPDGNDSWDGTFRCVSFARAEVDLEMVTDPLLAEVGWTWLTEALDLAGANSHDESGTVTAVSSRSFGEISDEPDRAEIEIRASWTPVIKDAGDITAHLQAWSSLLCTTAGLPQLPAGIVPLTSRMAR